MLLTEFDPARQAIANPTDLVQPVPGLPRVAVSCFARTTFARMVETLEAVPVATSSVANMEIPIYRAVCQGTPVALFLSDVGAPACVGLLEDVFAMGVEQLVLFGTCGVLDSAIADCSVIIPTAALRDEGTSFHYAPPSEELPVNPRYLDTFLDILNAHQCSYTLGKTWTTDALYRETRGKMERRRAQGCVSVDMECSAVAALAAFRQKEVFQFFYAADNLASEQWDSRSLSDKANLSAKDRVAQLALELAVRIAAGRD
ncbi:MAG: nucleoside phosphorylase [Clostridiales bacterium]|nr:nucleoside phosphorylase [Clostridiales bacterium]